MKPAEETFTNLSIEHGQPAMPPSHVAAGAPPAKPRSGACGQLGVCGIAWLSVLTVFMTITFILACWATNEARIIHGHKAFLTNRPPKSLPPDYKVYALGSGLGYWAQEPSMLHGRSDHGVVAVRHYAYLIGGLTSNGTASVLTSVVQYDTETGLAVEAAPLLDPRQRFAYALLGDTIYVMGGTNSVAGNAPPLRSVQRYNITSGVWSFVANMTAARIDPCGAALNGKVYIMGGYDATFTSLATMEEYNPASNTWTTLPVSSNLKVSRGDCRAAATANKIFAVGGVESFLPSPNFDCGAGDNWLQCYRFLRSVEAWDPVKRTWSPRANMTWARGDFAIDALPGNRILVAGGEWGNGRFNQIALHGVEVYDAADDVWTQKAPLPEARFRADAAYVYGRAFVFGGAPTCGVPGEEKTCADVALPTVFGFFDIASPNLYAYYQAPPCANPYGFC